MKPLPFSYSKNGYDFTLINRVKDVAIYKQTSKESGRFLAFEVFEVAKNNPRKLGDKVVDAWESTPGNEDWGSKGYTVASISKAEEKMRYLLDKIEKRKIGHTSTLSEHTRPKTSAMQ